MGNFVFHKIEFLSCLRSPIFSHSLVFLPKEQHFLHSEHPRVRQTLGTARDLAEFCAPINLELLAGIKYVDCEILKMAYL